MANYGVGIVVELVDKFSDPASKIRKQYNQINTDLNSVFKSSAVAGAGIASIGIAGITGLGLAVNESMKFEHQMSAVKAISGATVPEMKSLTDSALKFGRTTQFSAVEVGQGIEELAKAGLTTQQIINGGLAGTIEMASAGAINLADAANLAAVSMNAFKSEALTTTQIANILAGAANTSATDMNGLRLGMSDAAAVAALSGISFKDTATALAVLSQNGLTANTAGTALKTMLLRLTPSTTTAIDEMIKLGLATGKVVKVSKDGTVKWKMLSNLFYDSHGNMKSLAQVSDLLQEKLKNLTAEERTKSLQNIFGTEAIKGAAIFAKEGSKGFDTMQKAIMKITAHQVAEERLNNLLGRIDIFKNSLSVLGDVVGSFLIPKVKSLVEWLTKLVNKFLDLPKPVQENIINFVALSSIILTVGGGALLLFGTLGLLTTGFIDLMISIKAINLVLKTEFITSLALARASVIAFTLALGTNMIVAFTNVGIAIKTFTLTLIPNMITGITKAGTAIKTFTLTLIPNMIVGFSNAGTAIKTFVATIWTGFIPAIRAMSAAIWTTTIATLSNPATWGVVAIVAIITLIIYAALTIYRYWTPIKMFFIGMWEGIQEQVKAVQPEIDMITSAMKPLLDSVKGLWNWFTKLLTPINSTGTAAEIFGVKFGNILGFVIVKTIRLITLMFQLVSLMGAVASGNWGEIGGKVEGIKTEFHKLIYDEEKPRTKEGKPLSAERLVAIKRAERDIEASMKLNKDNPETLKALQQINERLHKKEKDEILVKVTLNADGKKLTEIVSATAERQKLKEHKETSKGR